MLPPSLVYYCRLLTFALEIVVYFCIVNFIPINTFVNENAFYTVCKIEKSTWFKLNIISKDIRQRVLNKQYLSLLDACLDPY